MILGLILWVVVNQVSKDIKSLLKW